MESKKLRIAGWVMSGLVTLLLISSSVAKFSDWEGKKDAFGQLGYSIEVMNKIGVVELTLAIMLVLPRTGFLAAILLTGYLGGATATHVRVGEPFFVPILIGVFMWFGIAFRKPQIFSLLIDK